MVATVVGVGGCASSNKEELGYELVGVSPASGIISAQDVVQLREGAWSWYVSLGDDQGQSLERRRERTDEYDASWVDTETDGRREYWRHDDDGNVVITVVVVPADHAITFFDPPMIFVYAELAPDGPREQKLNMRVMDMARPDRMKDRGTVTQTVQYVDDRRIRTPLGMMSTRRIDITFRADLKLARAETTTTLLLDPSYGIVVEKREDRVTVFGVPFRHRDQTLVLRQPPSPAREGQVPSDLVGLEADGHGPDDTR